MEETNPVKNEAADVNDDQDSLEEEYNRMDLSKDDEVVRNIPIKREEQIEEHDKQIEKHGEKTEVADGQIDEHDNLSAPGAQEQKKTRKQLKVEEDSDADDNQTEDDSEENNRPESEAMNTDPEHAPLSKVDQNIYIGSGYQADLPTLQKRYYLPNGGNTVEDEDKDERIWGTHEDLDESDLQEYVSISSGRFQMPVDRALYILQKSNYDIDEALMQVRSRREIKDHWSVEEESVFANCFYHFGKKFKKIQYTIPHRSMCSIVQYYYNTKKKNKYRIAIDVRLDEKDPYDDLCDEINKMEKKIAGVCENCHVKTEVLIRNPPMNRLECKTCVLYFRMMRVPRPSVRPANGETVNCPEYMKNYVTNYVDLMLPADGKAVERLHVGQKKEPEDDDCLVVDENPLRKPSMPYVVNQLAGDDPVDSNTCRHTRDFESPEALKEINRLRFPQFMCIPLIWRQKETRCMEECAVLNEEARRRILTAHASIGKVSSEKLATWRANMRDLQSRQDIRDEMERARKGESSATRSGRVRHDLKWSAEEKKDVVRCFHWYRDNFELIADVMGTKTAEQISDFYKKHETVIKNSIEKYMKAVQGRIDSMPPEDDN